MIVALLAIVVAFVAAAVPQKAEAVSLATKLRNAKTALREARERLAAIEDDLIAALQADPRNDETVARLRERVKSASLTVRRWETTVEKYAAQYRKQHNMAKWEEDENWMPIIRVAAAKYHVKADGIYRMMMRESGGQRFAGSNTAFKGLFQYWTGTWAASWNPWRRDSIYDGSSQIFATCYAVHKGYGPQFWTTTFASQY